MSELEDPNGYVRRDEAHERWLAMQSAYAEYLRVSEVYENRRESTRDSADAGRCDLTLLDCRRDAFERYLEARMEYLERRFAPLTAQRILAALHARRGEVVSYEELYQVIKSGRNRDNVRKHVSTIREAFREIDPGFDGIENVPMRGFRFSSAPR